MMLIPGVIGNLSAICISDIPFTMNICSDAIFGVLPLIGPAVNFCISGKWIQIPTDIIDMCIG